MTNQHNDMVKSTMLGLNIEKNMAQIYGDIVLVNAC